ncbi:hypothetical protein IFM89_004991 [Coptis chinensis]|uniref:BED-type domain-containing protein n=1 Tax=Coptis chinensis TaxID=261450 RepID=A0A835HKU3_9MAGN|nr:hypothetical protein IFM89_004991 [Coptis chinensis]
MVVHLGFFSIVLELDVLIELSLGVTYLPQLVLLVVWRKWLPQLAIFASAPSPSGSVSHTPINEPTPIDADIEAASISSDEEIAPAESPDPLKGKRSKVWLEFEIKKLGDGTSKAYCKHCKKSFDPSSKLGTTHLRNHLKACKIKKLSTSGQKLLCNSFSANEAPKLASWKYNPRTSRLDFARMVAKHDYPFLMAEHEYFRVFINGICPMFKWVSRTTVREDVMQLYNESRTELQDFFDKLPSKVSFTTDMWTPDYQNIGYCCVTCHYIDDEWVLRKKIIAYLTVPTPHSGVVLSEVIKAQALAWNVDRKLFAITVDNASNNNTKVDVVNELNEA